MDRSVAVIGLLRVTGTSIVSGCLMLGTATAQSNSCGKGTKSKIVHFQLRPHPLAN